MKHYAASLLGLFWCGLSLAVAPSARGAHAGGANRIYAIQSRIASPNFQLFLNLKPDSSVASTGPLFLLQGGVYAADFLGDTLYAVELDNVFPVDYLVTIPHEGAQRGQGVRVGNNPVGFPDVEGLAVAEGIIYGASLDSAFHRTTLIKIDPITGIGTKIGTSSRDVLMTGLGYDPIKKIMYGAAIPFGNTPDSVKVPSLFTVDMATGATTLVGEFGVRLESLSWDVELGLIGAFGKLYQINPQTGVATALGDTDFKDGKPASINGIYALAAYVPPLPAGFRVTGISLADGNVTIVWEATPNKAYRVEARANLSEGAWEEVSANVIASGAAASYTHTGGASGSSRFYRVKTVL